MSIVNSERVRLVRDSVGKIVRLLSEKDIPVRMKGSNAFVEWDEKTLEAKQVVLPVLPDDSSVELIEAVQGFLDHEVGHLLFTDQLAVVEAHERKIAQLHNIVEDCFIEEKMTKAFSGSRINLNKVGRCAATFSSCTMEGFQPADS